MRVGWMDGTRLKRKSDSREDVIAILGLLYSVSAALQMHRIDQVCRKSLASCANGIRMKHAVSGADFQEYVFCREPSFAALLRMLEYLRGEITATLNDQALGEQLAGCIALLTARRPTAGRH
jgi:hypothetical protein